MVKVAISFKGSGKLISGLFGKAKGFVKGLFSKGKGGPKPKVHSDSNPLQATGESINVKSTKDPLKLGPDDAKTTIPKTEQVPPKAEQASTTAELPAPDKKPILTYGRAIGAGLTGVAGIGALGYLANGVGRTPPASSQEAFGMGNPQIIHNTKIVQVPGAAKPIPGIKTPGVTKPQSSSPIPGIKAPSNTPSGLGSNPSAGIAGVYS